MKPETRHTAGGEVRTETGPDGKTTLRGYAAVFNSQSEDLGGFREVIRPGAFTRSLMGGDVRALVNHDAAKVLGRNTSGTMRLTQDARGLPFEIDLPDTSFARDLAVSVARGDVSGMSFRFYTADGGDSWGDDGNGGVLRELRDVEIDEISVVTFPAYRAAGVSVSARSREACEAYKTSLAAPARGPWLARARVRLRLAEASR